MKYAPYCKCYKETFLECAICKLDGEQCPSLDEMPITGEQIGIWRSNGNIYIISDDLFPDLKWTDSPKKVKITITPME